MCPMTGSTAARRRISRRIGAVTRRTADPDAELLGVVVATIAFVDVDAAGLDPGQRFQLGDHWPQSVAVKRVAVQRFGVQYKLTAPRFREGKLLGLVAGVATDTLQPNSYGVLAFPLPMHSTSGACSAYTCGRAAGDPADARAPLRRA